MDDVILSWNDPSCSLLAPVGMICGLHVSAHKEAQIILLVMEHRYSISWCVVLPQPQHHELSHLEVTQ